MLNRRLVTPSDFVDADAKYFGDFLPLGRTRCPSAQRDGQGAVLGEVGPIGELRDRETVLVTEVGDAVGHEKCPFHRVYLTQIGQIFRYRLIVPAIALAYTLY